MSIHFDTLTQKIQEFINMSRESEQIVDNKTRKRSHSIAKITEDADDYMLQRFGIPKRLRTDDDEAATAGSDSSESEDEEDEEEL